MVQFKTITHILAVVGAAIAAFVVSPAGKAVVGQYPILAPIVAVIGFAAAIYHTPKA